MDKLSIVDLEVYAKHGLYAEEKVLGQKFLISLDIFYNMSTAAKNADLAESINYGALSHDITDFFTSMSIDLIETCAYEVLKLIFEKYEFVEEVRVTIKKPWAPIGLPLKYPSVNISRKKRRYFIALGSNMGNSEEILNSAISDMKNNGIKIVKESSLYKTKAWGVTDQADFLNQVIEAESFEEPEDLLKILQDIENSHGRVRLEKWGPRTLDLDIIFVDDEVIYTDELIVPHPYAHEREFVLEPMNEIAPFFTHPVLKRQIREIYQELKKGN